VGVVPLFGGTGTGSPSNMMWPGPRPTSELSGILIHPAVFFHNRHGPKIEGYAPFLAGGAGSPCNAMSPGPMPTSVPSGTLIHQAIRPQYMGRKLGRGCCAPLFGDGWAVSPSNTMSAWPRPSPYQVTSSILIYPAVWQQRTWAENWGLCAFLGELGPHLTQCGQHRGLPPCQVSF